MAPPRAPPPPPQRSATAARNSTLTRPLPTNGGKLLTGSASRTQTSPQHRAARPCAWMLAQPAPRSAMIPVHPSAGFSRWSASSVPAPRRARGLITYDGVAAGPLHRRQARRGAPASRPHWLPRPPSRPPPPQLPSMPASHRACRPSPAKTSAGQPKMQAQPSVRSPGSTNGATATKSGPASKRWTSALRVEHGCAR